MPAKRRLGWARRIRRAVQPVTPVGTAARARSRPQPASEASREDSVTEVGAPPEEATPEDVTPEDVTPEEVSPEAATPAPEPLSPASQLVRHAERQQWSQVRPHLAAMEVVVTALGGRTDARVVVAGGPDAEAWSAILAAEWPELRISCVKLPDSDSATHARRWQHMKRRSRASPRTSTR